MLKAITRRLHNIPTKDRAILEPYLDTKLELDHRRMHKLYKDRTTIDFENIPEFFGWTRQPHHTLRYNRQHKLVAGLIKARDEFPEVNLVHNLKDVTSIESSIGDNFGWPDPYTVNIDEDEDEARCVVEDIVFHKIYRDWPMWVVWNRYIPGKPNRMLMKVVIDDWENSECKWRGGRLEPRKDVVWVNSYNEEYPRVLIADIKDKIPGQSYLLRDLQRDLPDGIELSPEYSRRMHEPLFMFRKSIKSYIYREMINNSFDISRMVDIEMATIGLPMESKKPTEAGVETNAITKQEEEKLKKLAKMLNKDYETLKEEMLAAREKKAKEAKKKK